MLIIMRTLYYEGRYNILGNTYYNIITDGRISRVEYLHNNNYKSGFRQTSGQLFVFCVASAGHKRRLIALWANLPIRSVSFRHTLYNIIIPSQLCIVLSELPIGHIRIVSLPIQYIGTRVRLFCVYTLSATAMTRPELSSLTSCYRRCPKQ